MQHLWPYRETRSPPSTLASSQPEDGKLESPAGLRLPSHHAEKLEHDGSSQVSGGAGLVEWR